jgi:hypothetical protein
MMLILSFLIPMVAEGKGIEPLLPCGRLRLSKPIHCHSVNLPLVKYIPSPDDFVVAQMSDGDSTQINFDPVLSGFDIIQDDGIPLDPLNDRHDCIHFFLS